MPTKSSAPPAERGSAAHPVILIQYPNELEEKKVLMTGAGGFIGSHLAEELLKRDAKRLLGWKLRYSLDEGLAHTIRYIRAHLSQYKADIYNV